MNKELFCVHKSVLAFRRKYYLRLTLRGVLLLGALLLAYFLAIAVVEYFLWFGSDIRLVFVLFFVLLGIGGLYVLLREPLSWWLLHRGLSEEDSARLIGRKLPTVGDRLVNIFQLERMTGNTDLIVASVRQKASALAPISFESMIPLAINKKLYYCLFGLLSVFLLLWIANKRILIESSQRIIHFDQEFTPTAPFRFVPSLENQTAFFNEDHTVRLTLTGQALPEEVHLRVHGQTLQMSKTNGGFEFVFEKLQQPLDIQFEAAGYLSPVYPIAVVYRPELALMKMTIQYPSYLNKPSETQQNTGVLAIPEGSAVTWEMRTLHTGALRVTFAHGEPMDLLPQKDNLFSFQKKFYQPDQYTVTLSNEERRNRDSISYRIDVVKDQYPAITAESKQDSLQYAVILLGGLIADDYANTRLALCYTTQLNTPTFAWKTIDIPIVMHRQQQQFFYAWALDSLQVRAGQRLDYYLKVWDNDGIHGPKCSQTSVYTFKMPTREAQEEIMRQLEKATAQDFEKSLHKAKELSQSVKANEEKLRSKQQIDWQDRKQLEKLNDQRNQLQEMIERLKQDHQILSQKLTEEQGKNERLKEKAEQLEKLINDLMDDEMKKIFEELQKKLLDENDHTSPTNEFLEKLGQKSQQIEKELERTLELFKQIRFDAKMESVLQQLQENIDAQKNILDKTEKINPAENLQTHTTPQNKPALADTTDTSATMSPPQDKKAPPSLDELIKDQQKLGEDFDDTQKSMEELKKMGEEKQEPPLKDNENSMKNADRAIEESEQELKNKRPEKSKEAQRKAIEEMQQIQKKMKASQEGMEIEVDEENVEAMRRILHNLVKLSFRQEDLLKNFRPLQQSDPLYVALSENQVRLEEDARMISDSMTSLAKKDPMISHVVTRKVDEMTAHLNKAKQHIKDRDKPQALSDMQYSMTAINNLALLLNDHYDMMQQALQNPKMGKGKKKGKKQPIPMLSKQQTKLNEKIQELKKSGKQGSELSEELVKLAAEQERIRRTLEEMEKLTAPNQKTKPGGGAGLGDKAIEQMKETELDLVNKRITEETIRRQQNIITRLLESEKSMREQGEDEERQAKTAKNRPVLMPKSFEEYLKLKQKEIELIQTVPPKLTPYFKNEVNKYFERIEN